LKDLNHVPEFKFEKDVAFLDFLNRIRVAELQLREQGLWNIPHPWLDLFVPKSRMADINTGIFKDIALKNNITTGCVLIYPMNKNKYVFQLATIFL